MYKAGSRLVGGCKIVSPLGCVMVKLKHYVVDIKTVKIKNVYIYIYSDTSANE